MITPSDTWCYVHFSDGSVLGWPSSMFGNPIHETTINHMIEQSDRILVREELMGDEK
ncbi:hypothetical protein [Alteromonas australica]|uniref:hypothetical protein n=1 Tax=Alteromonas australica TaxID=589873 RepID=UPI002355092B|nr:hypothetical protein [Alteromonas australica]|tara:strand:- start:26931 stop:27101 length:171 start_codon:yes stop_codon:yes gene_type:complete